MAVKFPVGMVFKVCPDAIPKTVFCGADSFSDNLLLIKRE